MDFAIGETVEPIAGEIAEEPSEEAAIYQALVLGVRDYGIKMVSRRGAGRIRRH